MPKEERKIKKATEFPSRTPENTLIRSTSHDKSGQGDQWSYSEQ